MCINDLPQASHFNTTPFADDTYLAFSDRNVIDLERRVNNELRNVDAGLKKKISLNSSKSCYILINKQLNISCECDLQLYLNSFFLKREETVKYSGIYIDDNLKWSTRIHHLSFQ